MAEPSFGEARSNLFVEPKLDVSTDHGGQTAFHKPLIRRMQGELGRHLDFHCQKQIGQRLAMHVEVEA